MSYPLSVISGPLRTARRFQQILFTLVRFGFEDIVRELGLPQMVDAGRRVFGQARRQRSEEVEQLPTATRVRRVMEELGPTFIKLGQILSTRPDLLPLDWVEEFKKLQSDVPQESWPDIEEALKLEYPQGLSKVFRHIEQQPMAAASIAQVHRATTAEGEDIVLKILRPGIRETISADIEIMRTIAGIMESRFQQTGYSPREVVEQFSREIKRETDLETEGITTDRMHRDFADNPRINFPKVHWALTTRQVLALEEIHGTLLNRLDTTAMDPQDRHNLLENGSEAVFCQCLELGFFHADPHPGNIFVLEGGRICLIDCGMTGRLDPETTALLADLVYGVVHSDLDRVVQVSMQLCDADPNLNHNRQFRAEIWEFIDVFTSGSLEEMQVGQMLQRFFDLLRHYDMQAPADLLYLIKALTTIEGVAQGIDPDFDVVARARPYVERLIQRRYSLRSIRKRALNAMLDYGQMLQELPGQIRELFHTFQQNRMQVTVEHKGLSDLTQTLNEASLNVATALVFASLVVGSSVLVLAESINEQQHWALILATAGYVAAFVVLVGRVLRNLIRWR